MSVHARLSASSAHRWLKCAGSVGGESTSSVYAAAGTFAHHIAAECLKNTKETPGNWLGNKTIIDGHEVECDQEMVDTVAFYIDTARVETFFNGESWVEMPLLDALQKVDKDMGGTADYVTYSPGAKRLVVIDFKFGSGTYVEAESNEQLMVYALGAMLATDKLIHEVEVVIVQPRHEGAAPVRSWTFKAVEILDFVADLQEAADRTRLPDPPLAAGDWCKFCPKAHTCPELEKIHHALVAAEFANVARYNPAKLADALASIPMVKERIKAIEEFAYSEATRGTTIPGFKLVDKRATRKWKSDDGDLHVWADQNAVDLYAEPELLSPAQLEKRIGGGKKTTALLEPFVEKISSGTVLVPVSDERAPAKLISATDFEISPEDFHAV